MKDTHIELDLDELKMQANDYTGYMMEYAGGYITGLFKQGIITDITAEKLQKYFANPDKYQSEIDNLTQYFYVINAEVHQMFELIEVLPQLNYRIESFSKSKSNEKHILSLNKALHSIKHKRLTRDLMKQGASVGNVVGMWLGDKANPYAHVFDEVKYVFAIGRNIRGEWACVIDMSWFDGMSEPERDLYFSNLSPYVTKTHYEEYCKNHAEKRYVALPYDRTFVIRTGVLKRNQAQGTSWITSGLLDVLHKRKLKDVEQSIANKIINAIAVLTIGSDKNPEYTNMKLPKAIKQRVHSGVKTAMEKNNNGGVTVVSIPDYAKLEFPDINADGLDGEKFNNTNSDIRTAYSLSGAVLNGEGTNYASSKLNLDVFYKRLAVLLEDIESDVYQKLFNLILPSNQKDNYYLVYDKEAPLTLKEKVDYLAKLNDKGWSSKHFIEAIGMNFESFVEQTLFETEELELQNRIKPYANSFTTSGNGDAEIGAPTIDDNDVTSENTIRSRESDNNNTPS